MEEAWGDLMQLFSQSPSNNEGNQPQVAAGEVEVGVRRHFLTGRAVRHCSGLPRAAVGSPSLGVLRSCVPAEPSGVESSSVLGSRPDEMTSGVLSHLQDPTILWHPQTPPPPAHSRGGGSREGSSTRGSRAMGAAGGGPSGCWGGSGTGCGLDWGLQEQRWGQEQNPRDLEEMHSAPRRHSLPRVQKMCTFFLFFPPLNFSFLMFEDSWSLVCCSHTAHPVCLKLPPYFGTARPSGHLSTEHFSLWLHSYLGIQKSNSLLQTHNSGSHKEPWGPCSC